MRVCVGMSCLVVCVCVYSCSRAPLTWTTCQISTCSCRSSHVMALSHTVGNWLIENVEPAYLQLPLSIAIKRSQLNVKPSEKVSLEQCPVSRSWISWLTGSMIARVDYSQFSYHGNICSKMAPPAAAVATSFYCLVLYSKVYRFPSLLVFYLNNQL